MRKSSWKAEIASYIFHALASIDRLVDALTKVVLPLAQGLEEVRARHLVDDVNRSLTELRGLRDRIEEMFRELAPQGISTVSRGEEIGGGGEVIDWQDVDWDKTIADNPDWGKLQRLMPKLDDILGAMNSLEDVDDSLENISIKRPSVLHFADYFSDTVFESLNRILAIIRWKGETVPRGEGVRGDILGARQGSPTWKREISEYIGLALAGIYELRNFLMDIAREATESDLPNTIEEIIGRLDTMRGNLVDMLQVLVVRGEQEEVRPTGEEEVREVAWTEINWEEVILDYPDWELVKKCLPTSDFMEETMRLLQRVDNSQVFKQICLIFGFPQNLSVARYFQEEIKERVDSIIEIVDEKLLEERKHWARIREEELPPPRYEGTLNTLKENALRLFKESQEIIEKYLSEVKGEKAINLVALQSLFEDAVMGEDWEEIKSLWETFDGIGGLVLKYLDEQLKNPQLAGPQTDVLETDKETLSSNLQRLAGAVGALGLVLGKAINTWKFILLRRLIR